MARVRPISGTGGRRATGAGPTPLAEFLDGCMHEALARQGFAGADIIASWQDIAGERLARHARPIRMEWPRRRRGAEPGESGGATLFVRVSSAFALELQQSAPLIIQRVNAHYGWACLARIAIRQGPAPEPAPVAAPPAPLEPAAVAKIARAVDPVVDEGLRRALSRFGEAVIRSRRAHTKP